MSGNKGEAQDIRENVAALAENLVGLQSVAKIQLTLTKSEAAHFLWSLAVQSNARRMEIVKANCLPHLVNLLSSGSQEGKYNAVGCLQHLTTSDDIRSEIIFHLSGAKPLQAIAKLLTGTHDRSRLCAAILLKQLSLIPEFSKMTLAIPYLVELLGMTEPDWAGIATARANAAVCLRNLAVSKDLRYQIYKEGGIPNLINMLVADKIQGTEGRTAAVSCLNILAEDDYGVEGLLEGRAIPALVKILEARHDMENMESKAHAAGCLWNIVLEDNAREELTNVGGIPPLVMMLKGLKGDDKKKKGKKKEPPLPPAVDMSQRNAAGTIWHLSFSDDCKRKLAEAGAVEPLVKLLNSRNEGTRENATGALWNLALDLNNIKYLVAGKAPRYLIYPVHPRWLGPRPPKEEEGAGEGGALSAKRPAPLAVGK